MGFWKKMKKGVSNVTNTVVNTTTNVVNTVVNTTTNVANTAVNTTTNNLKQGVCLVNDSVDAATNKLKKDAVKINEESNKALGKINETVLTQVGESVVNTAKQTSKSLGDSGETFLAGATIVGEGFECAGDFVVNTAEAAAEWIDENACEIGMGVAFGALFGAMLYRPEPESVAQTSATMAPLSCTAVAYIAAKEIGQEAVMGAIIGVACDLTATSFVELIWQIPEVKKGVGNKNKEILTSAISFTIAKSLDAYAGAYVIPQSGAAVICGIVGSMATRLICSGTVPKNWRDWAETASAGA
jgi:hypothetical protein